MGCSLVKNDIHLVFHIKCHSMEIRDEDLDQVFAYIGGIINNMNGIPIAVGGIGNHIHILTTLPKAIALTEFVKNIKAYSSKWIKTLDERYYEGFAWQAGYGAFSVDYRHLDQTAQYIRNQAEHHHRTEWREEYKRLLDDAGVEYDERYAFETD
ncbi:MAG: transposase [Bacteroidales bacterium]|nr:transposase [Bacteroidales bacterium]